MLDLDWTPQPYGLRIQERPSAPVPRPENLSEMIELARKNTDIDFLKEPGVNHFHPGPLLAIYEELNGDVNRDDGFWWVYIKDGKFTKDKPEDFK